MDKKLLVGAAAGALLFAGAAKAETDTVNIAQQFGLLYVPLHVVMDQKLVEKHAKKAGIPVPKMKMFK
ncbi:MAG: ABC transporter substrate-binding protein, partial [Alphaproteobacteria bacterium]|nr:ABC transporter substrate-binding protein [Alphaproteobacteria bacterium]